jgi:hypothetical protein
VSHANSFEKFSVQTYPLQYALHHLRMGTLSGVSRINQVASVHHDPQIVEYPLLWVLQYFLIKD